LPESGEVSADVRGRERFPRSNRLRRRADFLAAQEQGRRFSSANYLLLVRRRSDDESAGPGPRKRPGREPRLGITVSRKVGGAVDRNRVKRWVRESYRRLRPLAPEGMDLVLIARPSAPKSGLSGTTTELRQLLLRLRPR
jgi:ribonuclease P protein component